MNLILPRRLVALEKARQFLELHDLRGRELSVPIDRLSTVITQPETRLQTSDGHSTLVRETPEEISALLSQRRGPPLLTWSHALARRVGRRPGEMSQELESWKSGKLLFRQQVAWGQVKVTEGRFRRNIGDFFGRMNPFRRIP
ncbi:MAG: hypothetical protein RL095_709 [Verrucomicrobiota bacterium]|jgi:hypothetical protein